MKQESIVNAALVLMTGSALIVTGLLVRHELFPPTSASTAMITGARVRDWSDYARAGHRLGNADTPVTIIEFSDFQCPYCLRLWRELGVVRTQHQQAVSIIYRHFPLRTAHPHAYAAAVAAECAADQGRFEQLHDALYIAQDSIGAIPWWAFAARAHVLDSARFAGCMEDSSARKRVDADISAGNRLRVRSSS